MDSYYDGEELREFGFRRCGKNVRIHRTAGVYDPEQTEIGDNVRIDDWCVLSGKVVLGNFIHIGVSTRLLGSTAGVFMRDFSGVSYNSTITANTEDYSGEHLTNPTVPQKYRQIRQGSVVLEKHVVIAMHCVVLPGVTIGEGAAIGAMSLVNKNVEPWSISFGIPARRIKDRRRDLLELEAALMKELAT